MQNQRREFDDADASSDGSDHSGGGPPTTRHGETTECTDNRYDADEEGKAINNSVPDRKQA